MIIIYLITILNLKIKFSNKNFPFLKNKNEILERF